MIKRRGSLQYYGNAALEGWRDICSRRNEAATNKIQETSVEVSLRERWRIG
jgi:hypothetical protein